MRTRFLSRVVPATFLMLALAAWTCAQAPNLIMARVGGMPPATTAPAASKTPADLNKHVLLVSIDGLRPDVALRADMPNLRGLMKRGSFTFWAQTTHVAITLPSHTSMLTGVPPEVHGVTWNIDLPLDRIPNWPKVPTLFEYAKASGYTTAMVAGKPKFCVFQKPGVLDWSMVNPGGKTSDEVVGQTAAQMIKDHQPNVLFVHLPMVDSVGHALGWGSDAQVRAVEDADKALGVVLAAVEAAKLTDKTLIIVTADHGGSGLGHGGDDPRSKHIPWVIAGPGVLPNHDLTLHDPLVVHTEDSFATLMDYLKLDLPAHCQGQVVKEAFADSPVEAGGR